MWERIFVILRKELIQALREPRMRVLLFVPPIVQLLVFGFAVNLDVDHARIAWMDMDRTAASRSLRDRFTGSGRFDIVSAPEAFWTCATRAPGDGTGARRPGAAAGATASPGPAGSTSCRRRRAKRTCSARWIAARRRRWCAFRWASRARPRAGGPPKCRS